jgi:uncharacterized phage protein (TIGR01671 family)
MREIKFRAWLKEFNKLVQLHSITFNPSIYSRNGFIEYEVYPTTDIRKKGNLAMVSMDDVVLMQYTGLKDVNGKEIYEGDIVKIGMHTEAQWHEPKGLKDRDGNQFRRQIIQETTPITVVIKYNIQHSTQFGHGESFGTIWGGWNISAYGRAENIHPEIIGNIYEDQELLKGE